MYLLTAYRALAAHPQLADVEGLVNARFLWPQGQANHILAAPPLNSYKDPLVLPRETHLPARVSDNATRLQKT